MVFVTPFQPSKVPGGDAGITRDRFRIRKVRNCCTTSRTRGLTLVWQVLSEVFKDFCRSLENAFNLYTMETWGPICKPRFLHLPRHY